MSKIKCIIIEDEPLAAKVLSDYILQTPFLDLQATFKDAILATDWLRDNITDLIFLDIHLPKLKGMAFLKTLVHPPAVIVTTAYHQYAVEGFDLNVTDYLLKPFSKDRFNKAIEKYLAQAPAVSSPKHTDELLETAAQSPAQHERIVVKTGTKVKIIPVQDVQYLAADDDYVSVFTAEGSFLKNKTMNFFENTLDPRQFVRVHRSYIIAIQQITRIDPYEKDAHLAILKSGAKIPVSKTGYVKLKQVLGI